MSARWLLLPFFLLPLTLLCAGDKPGSADWKFDVIDRKQGDSLRGLILEEDGKSIRIRTITRKPGTATLFFTHVVPRGDVKTVTRLTTEEREQLQERIEALKRERDVLADHLRALDPRSKGTPRSADLLDLQPATWPGDDKVKVLSYQSTHFKLLARTCPELAQLAAVSLEQIYDAYARALPSRVGKAEPTTILLTGSWAQYQSLAKSQKLNLFNPAYYDPANRQVVCGSDLERLRDDLEKVRAHHARTITTLEERRLDLVKAYRGAPPKEMLQPLSETKARIEASEKRNDDAFRRTREKLFRRLYHEAFHAYLGTFVYPGKENVVPVWFNEGLAQIFETAVVELGELSVGRPDRERWETMRQALARDELMPLRDLLRSGPRQFQVAHASEQQASDRYYLAAWALTFYLTFEQRLLGGKALDDYVAALERGTEPLTAFQDLVGQPLPAFEKGYLTYLRHLQENGTSKRPGEILKK